jgi:ArsR family transcriptional regulator
MKLKSRKAYEARAKVAKALAHPSRLLMLDALGQKDLCVCELTELVGADQSTVSKHLSVLKGAGLVDDRKQGTMVIYTIRPRCLEGFFTCLERVIADNLEAQRAALGI